MDRIHSGHYAEVLRRLHALLGDMQMLATEYLDGADNHAIAQGFADVCAAVARLELRVTAAAVKQLSQQIRQVSSRLVPGEWCVHLGAGSTQIPGWINIDAPPSDLCVNLARGIPLPTASVRLLFCSHLLEHLFYPSEAHTLLRDCYRVLAPGGRIRLIVPDAELCLRAYAQGDGAFFESRRRQWDGWPQSRTALEDTLPYLGAFPDAGALYETHRYGYDFETLRAALRRVGFTVVERSHYMASGVPELRIDDASSVAGNTFGDNYFSMFVEAQKDGVVT